MFFLTINKSQGQSLSMIGIDLGEYFSHGQFHAAFSRVISASSLVILVPKGNTTNIVHKEIRGWIKYIDLNVGQFLNHDDVIT